MNILMLLDSPLPDVRVEKEKRSLEKAGHQVKILSCTKYKYLKALLPFLPFYWWAWYFMVRKQVRDFQAIHIHDLPLAKVGTFFPGYLLTLDLHENYPSLLSLSHKHFLHRLIFSKRLWYRYERRMVARYRNVIVVCREMQHRLGKGVIVENTPDRKVLNIDTNTDRLTLLYIGSLKNRNLERISDICQEMDIDFTIISGQDLSKIIIKANIGIIPYIESEQFDCSSPNKLFEYMQAGLPVVSAQSKSIRRIVYSEICGFTYKNDEGLRIILRAFKTDYEGDRSLIKTFADNGKESIARQYNWEQSSKPLLRLYEPTAQNK